MKVAGIRSLKDKTEYLVICCHRGTWYRSWRSHVRCEICGKTAALHELVDRAGDVTEVHEEPDIGP